MTRQANHTPTPWARGEENNTGINICGPDFRPVARVPFNALSTSIADANTDLIIRAVNAHDALVTTLTRFCSEELFNRTTLGEALRDARAALKLAEG